VTVTVLNPSATTRELVERVNVLGRDHNGRHTAVAVADLPANPGFYDQWMVSDATATTFWSVVAGGGANIVPVRWDGADWRIG
jgi:hypothetical protein